MDPEVEMMRADLLLLPEEQLLTLAADAGVRTLGRSARDIVEALLNLDFDADAAAAARAQQAHSAHGRLASQHAHMGPVTGRHGGTQQQLQHSQQQLHAQQAAAAGGRKQQQHVLQPGQQRSAAAAAYAAAVWGSATGAQMRQHTEYHHHQEGPPLQQQARVCEQGRQQLSGRLDESDALGQRVPSFTFAPPRTRLPAQEAHTGGASLQRPAAQRAYGVDRHGPAYLDQGVPAESTPPAAAAAGHGNSGSCNRTRSPTPPRSGREARQQQHLVLETKFQQLEQSLQQLQLSPRITQHSLQGATPGSGMQGADSGARGRAGSSDFADGSSGEPEARTNRKLWATPPSGGSGQRAPAPGVKAATRAAVTPQREARRSAGGPSNQGNGRSPEACRSSGSGINSSSSNAHRSITPGRAPPQQQQQQHARELVLSPAPAKGTPRVGVMPCQKALLKKAAAHDAAGRVQQQAGAACHTPVRSAAAPRAAGRSSSGNSSRSSSRAVTPLRSQRPATSPSLDPAVARTSAEATTGSRRPRTAASVREAAAAASTASRLTRAQQQQQGSVLHKPQREQEQLSMTGVGLAVQASQLLEGQATSDRRARERVPPAGPGGPYLDPPPRPQQQCLQQQGPAALKSGQLHTPLRVKAPAKAAGGKAGALLLDQQPPRGYATPSKPCPAAAAAAAAVAVTPARQQVQAFGNAGSAAATQADMATPAAARSRVPIGSTAAAAAGFAAADAPGGLMAGLMTPKGVAMGSARRVVSTQSRTGLAAAAAAAAAAASAAAAAGQDTAAVADRGGSSGGSSGAVPVTPLHKGPRRTVPTGSGAADELDKHLQSLVERCLRLRNPGTQKLSLQGPQPAKRWLQQYVVGPWKRAGGSSSSSGGVGRACSAAGYCSRAVLLHGPAGTGKTELVHALAGAMGADLLYVHGGDNLLGSYQQEGHRLLRALFAVARRAAPCVVCFDDAHITFPAEAASSADAGDAGAYSRMVVEASVQLQQLADMQAQLEAARLQGPDKRASTSAISAGGTSGVAGSAKKPVWGLFGKGKSKQQQQQEDEADSSRQHQQKQQQQPAHALLLGPVVVVFVAQAPGALDGALLQQLPVRLLLDLPDAEAREELLMGWLMEREAAVNVQELEWLARRTEGFSCSELVHLCRQAALRPAQERSSRAVCMGDLEAALQSMLAT